MASGRGAVAGRLLLQEPNKEVVDCSTCGSSGYAISGDLNLLENLIMKTDARYIIVVEKFFSMLYSRGWLRTVYSIKFQASSLQQKDIQILPQGSFFIE